MTKRRRNRRKRGVVKFAPPFGSSSKRPKSRYVDSDDIRAKEKAEKAFGPLFLQEKAEKAEMLRNLVYDSDDEVGDPSNRKSDEVGDPPNRKRDVVKFASPSAGSASKKPKSRYVDYDIQAEEKAELMGSAFSDSGDEVGDPPNRKRDVLKFASPSAGSASKKPKSRYVDSGDSDSGDSDSGDEVGDPPNRNVVNFPSDQASYADPSPASIQLVKDYIESGWLMKALRHIKAIESKFPFSLITQALKAHVHATIDGVDGAPVLLEDPHRIFSDKSFVQNVMPIWEALWLNVDDIYSLFKLYDAVPSSLCDRLLMRRMFDYHSRILPELQHKVSLQMYKLFREDKFLFWTVFCIQLMVLEHFIKDHRMCTLLDEPEPFLVYMSAPEPQKSFGLVGEILCKLGPTLLVVKANKQHLEWGRLLARVCDYSAAVEFLKGEIDDREDWECLTSDFDHSVEDYIKCCGGAVDCKIHPLIYVVCQISELPNETQCGSKILEQLKLWNLEKVRSRCLLDGKDNDVFEEAAYEYFTRVDPTTQQPFRIFSKDEEYWLIENLLKQDVLTTDLLKENLSKICTVSKIPRYSGDFCLGVTSAVHGLMIVVKTSKFIILAGDGVLTSRYSDNALFSTTDKIIQFDDLCIGVNGVFKILGKTVSNMRKYVRQVKKDTRFRPTVKASANYIAKNACMLKEAFEVFVCGFDELEVGQPPVPSVSCAMNYTSWDVNKPFHCSGRFGNYAASILSEAKIGADTGLIEAIRWVERALVFPAIFDSCIGGLGNITVIDNCKNVTVMARELIHTTLWERHHLFFEKKMSP